MDDKTIRRFFRSKSVLNHKNINSIFGIFLNVGFVETSNFMNKYCLGNRIVNVEKGTAKARVIDDSGSCFLEASYANEWQDFERER